MHCDRVTSYFAIVMFSAISVRAKLFVSAILVLLVASYSIYLAVG